MTEARAWLPSLEDMGRRQRRRDEQRERGRANAERKWDDYMQANANYQSGTATQADVDAAADEYLSAARGYH